MPDFTVPPEWKGPGEVDASTTAAPTIIYRKLCQLAHEVAFELSVIFDKEDHQACALLIDGPDEYIVLPMKSIQVAFNVAEAISAGLSMDGVGEVDSDPA